MARVILAAVFFIIILTFGALAIQPAMETGGEPYSVTDEEVALSGTGTYNVSNTEVPNAAFQPHVTVENASGIQMVEGVDYEWNEANGTITVLSGGGLASSATLTIDYDYNIPSDRQRELATFVGQLFGTGEVFMWAFGAIIAIVFIRLLSGAG